MDVSQPVGQASVEHGPAGCQVKLSRTHRLYHTLQHTHTHNVTAYSQHTHTHTHTILLSRVTSSLKCVDLRRGDVVVAFGLSTKLVYIGPVSTNRDGWANHPSNQAPRPTQSSTLCGMEMSTGQSAVMLCLSHGDTPNDLECPKVISPGANPKASIQHKVNYSNELHFHGCIPAEGLFKSLKL